MFKTKNIARLLLVAGAVMVSIHTVGVLFVFCEVGNQCLANIYFGIPENNTIPLVSDFSMVSGTTEAIVGFSQSSIFSDIHAVVQVTGLYLILIGIVTLLLLEVKQLRYVRYSRLVRK